jgi:indole-3-glycerol phosphate synthase/phosphoribosylanthranilate isomerase
MKTRVKVCGLRRAADAALAIELGATHLGCVLVPDSPRCASLRDVARVLDAAGDAAVVLVFRNATAGTVLAAVEATGVRRVQVHGAGDELLGRLETAGCLVHRVYSIEPGARVLPALAAADETRPQLLDVAAGGSGRRFDWTLLGGRAPHATFIGGGITPENVGALLCHAPWGIDVSSGVESAPGVKDPGRLKALFASLRQIA